MEAVAAAAQRLGRGARLTNLDIKSAYRLVPVHQHDRHLLGVEWQGVCYVNGALLFGLRSAPKIYTAVADDLQWIMMNEGVSLIDYYLDDHGPARLRRVWCNLDRILAVCRDLGVPLVLEKLEGPSHCLTFLGIEMDTLACKLWPTNCANLIQYTSGVGEVGIAYWHLALCLSGCKTEESIPDKDD